MVITSPSSSLTRGMSRRHLRYRRRFLLTICSLLIVLLETIPIFCTWQMNHSQKNNMNLPKGLIWNLKKKHPKTLRLLTIDKDLERRTITSLSSLSTTSTLSTTALTTTTTTSTSRHQNEICQVPPGMGVEGKWGYQVLVKVKVAEEPKKKGIMSTSLGRQQRKNKLLCLVLTDSTRHESHLRAIMDTYGPHCDGFLACSNQTQWAFGAIHVWKNSFPPSPSPPPSETYAAKQKVPSPHHTYRTTAEWQKVQQVWTYVYEHYRDQYDWFHLVHDNAYVIPQNIRFQLSMMYDGNSGTTSRAGESKAKPSQYQGKKEQQPLYLGSPVITQQDPRKLYCGGGAGFTLNRAALDRVSQLTRCRPNSTDPADQVMAECLHEHYNLKCRTLLGPDGEWFYHEYGLTFLARYNRETDLGAPIFPRYLMNYHGIEKANAFRGIAEYSTSFHLVDSQIGNRTVPIADVMRRFHAIVFRLCDDQWERSLGALDASGKPGYVHDPYFVKNHPLPFQFHPTGDTKSVCEIPFGKGPEGRRGIKGLQKVKIIHDIPTGYRRKRILCIVYTHSNRHDRIRAIVETYATRCDGFMAASNLTDPTLGTVNLLHEGPEACTYY